MVRSLCEKFGFDQKGRDERLILVRLITAVSRSDDIKKVNALFSIIHKEIIEPKLNDIIEQFYQYVLGHKAMSSFLADENVILRLRETQKLYLLSLGIDFELESYFENRLKIGLAHAKIALPLSVYQCAYTCMQEIINYYINLNSTLSVTEKEQCIIYLHRMNTLDQSLAIDTYFKTNIQNLEQSIIQLENKSANLKTEVDFDDLTKVHSRRKIIEYLAIELDLFNRDGVLFAIVMIDIDNFKGVNDDYGHISGDEILKNTAARISGAVRKVDIVGRYGGEEFIVLLPNTDIDTAKIICERIRIAISETVVKCEENLISVTISQGVTIVRLGDTNDSAIKRADKLMYKSKQKGRNCVTWD